jgi:SOR/SNZ family/SNO glutamine amidotransferase family
MTGQPTGPADEAQIRSKGEAGTGNVVEATRHMRCIRSQIARLSGLAPRPALRQPRRNAFGRQVDSFETDLSIAGLGGGPYRGVFIRAHR